MLVVLAADVYHRMVVLPREAARSRAARGAVGGALDDESGKPAMELLLMMLDDDKGAALAGGRHARFARTPSCLLYTSPSPRD